MKNKTTCSLTEQQAHLIKESCIKAAKEGFMDASIQGLCTEGAIEAAVSAIQLLDLKKLLTQKP